MALRALRAAGLLLTTAAAPLWASQSPTLDAQKSGTAAPAAFLDRAQLPARGRQTARLSVAAFGRYAIRVSSKQGTALQLVDRMAGPGALAGQTGESDGRLDSLLDRGEYQLLTLGHRNAKGAVKIDVSPFTERHTPQAPLLVELKPVEDTLRDLEQISYWLDLQQTSWVWLEAAGRDLADLRLWRDGSWLLDARPETELVQPVDGRPLLLCRLAVQLDPGLYLLTAYGGAERAWANDDGGHPFHLRWGIPRLGRAGRQRRTISPFGRDLFIVPEQTNFFRLELPEARRTTLDAGSLDPAQPFTANEAHTSVEKTSRPPVAELTIAGGSPHVVAIAGEAGRPYVLQHFELRDVYQLSGSGEYWVGSIHAGAAVDSIDATGILVRETRRDGNAHWEPTAEQTIALDARSGWSRKVNLLDLATLFVHVSEPGSYAVTVDGVPVDTRVEPFFVWRPNGYQEPEWRPSPSAWELDAGFYVVSLAPKRKGVATISLKPVGLLDRALDVVGMAREQPLLQPRPALRFAPVTLEGDASYTLYLNRQPEVRAGGIVRPLPLDLSEPLPVAQSPDDKVLVPFRCKERGTLRAESESGPLLELRVDGGTWATEPQVAAGDHSVTVRLPGQETVVYALRFDAERLAATTPLPALADGRLASLPRFETLRAGAPLFFDLPEGSAGSRTVLVSAERAGLYRVQSTGLLSTAGTLRSRTVTSLARESQNGVGRNFALGQYLREGDYQVTVQAEGSSRGHLGLELAETRIATASDLMSRVPARATLAAGEAIAYRFRITKPGRFRVRSLGLGRSFRCRLEDGRGWPLLPPGGTADVTLDFRPGRYRFVVLPEVTPARVVTWIEPVAGTRLRRGHGPHPLPLARKVEHVWTEPASGTAERAPDVWELRLPAPATVRVELTGGMEGRIVAKDAPDAPPIEVPVRRGYEGRLAAGAFRLEVVSARPNNLARYELAVWPEPLLAGLERAVTAPAELAVTVGTDGLYEIASFGATDVRGRLFDSEGRVVARSDDRPDDWNLQLALTLRPGDYRLKVEPVGAATAFTTVSMRRREDREEAALAVPATVDLDPGATVHVYPLTVPPQTELLAVSARSAESLGLALEAREGDDWRSLATGLGREAHVESPLAAEREYRLRVWSLDRRQSPTHVRVVALSPAHVGESQARSAVALRSQAVGATTKAPAREKDVDAAAAAIAIDRPGSFRVEGAGARWCTTPLAACVETATGIVSAEPPLLWAVAPGGTTVSATRVSLDTRPLPVAAPRHGQSTIDVAPGKGALLVRATSQGGQPGLALGEAKAVRRSGRFAVGTRSAVAVALDETARTVLVWDATPGPAPVSTELEASRYAVRRTDAGDRAEGELEPGVAQALALPRGVKRLRLALSSDVTAALSRDGEVDSVLWADLGASSETVETEADVVTLFAPREGRGRYALEVFRLDEDERTLALAATSSWEGERAQSGRLRLAIAATKGASRLAVRGASAEPLFVSDEGEVRRGSDLELPAAGGTLTLAHGTALVVAMREPRSAQDDLGHVETVKPPAAVALGGKAMTLRVEAAAPTLLQLRAPGAATTLLRRADEASELALHRDGIRLDAYLPAGRTDVTLRAVAGATLHGQAELTTKPVSLIGEGLGPEVLLGPGESRLFAFSVTQKGPVGLGVRGDSDTVEAALLSSEGRLLGRGATQMPVLEPGRYLLELAAPADATPVRVQPAVVGLVVPDTGPPQEVLRQYLTAPEQEPGTSFTARRIEQPAEAVVEQGSEEEAAAETEGTPEMSETEGAETEGAAETGESPDEAPGEPQDATESEGGEQ